MRGSPDYQGFERGHDSKKIKEEDRSLDLEEKPRLPPEVTPKTEADITAKQDSKHRNLSVRTEQGPSKTTLVMSKKEVNVARTKKTAYELEQRDRATKVGYRAIKFVEEEVTTENWQWDLLMEGYHWKTLKT